MHFLIEVFFFVFSLLTFVHLSGTLPVSFLFSFPLLFRVALCRSPCFLPFFFPLRGVFPSRWSELLPTARKGSGKPSFPELWKWRRTCVVCCSVNYLVWLSVTQLRELPTVASSFLKYKCIGVFFPFSFAALHSTTTTTIRDVALCARRQVFAKKTHLSLSGPEPPFTVAILCAAQLFSFFVWPLRFSRFYLFFFPPFWLDGIVCLLSSAIMHKCIWAPQCCQKGFHHMA